MKIFIINTVGWGGGGGGGGGGIYACSRGILEGRARVYVDTRSLKFAKNVLKYLYFYKICPSGQSGRRVER